MTENTERATEATALDDAALDQVSGGEKTYTGGRFQLDIGSYSVGYLKKYSPEPAPPPPPPVKP